MKKIAVILLSGGPDSGTCLAIAASQGYECHALSFDYGQHSSHEVIAAEKIARHLNAASHRTIRLDTTPFTRSALTNTSMPMPIWQGETSDIPVTYVPARNTIFLSLALGYAETIGAFDIFIGANAVDYSNYPDCRPEYIQAFQSMANLATKMGVEGQSVTIHAPLLYLTKAEILLKGAQLGLDLSLTESCYQLDHEGKACGTCSSCGLRKKGFKEANLVDPTQYRN